MIYIRIIRDAARYKYINISETWHTGIKEQPLIRHDVLSTAMFLSPWAARVIGVFYDISILLAV